MEVITNRVECSINHTINSGVGLAHHLCVS